MTASIAVIDDDEQILDAVRMVLRNEDWRVQIYSSGDEFLKRLDQNAPDCVILDPDLPGVSGGEVAKRIHQHDSGTPIIGLSSQPDSLLAMDVINAGAHAMLIKPVSAAELVRQVRAALMQKEVE